MPYKRKHPPSYASQGSRKNPRLNSRFQKRHGIEDITIDLSDPSSLPLQTIERVQKAVEEKIEHGKKLVFRGLKKAKGFEKQKLVKRLKIARGKGENGAIKKLELELDVLKTEEIELNSLASDHTLKILSKLKPISTSPLFPPWLVLQKEPEAQLNSRETARRNIITRLYNSNPVKEAVLVVVGNVKSVMGISEGDTKAVAKGVEAGIVVESVGEGDEEGGGGGGGGGGATETAHLVKGTRTTDEPTTGECSESGEEEEWGGISDLGELADSGMGLDAFAANFEDRLARSSDEDEDQNPLQRGTDDEWSGEDEEDNGGSNEEEEEEEEEEGQTQDAKSIATRFKPEQKSEPKDQSEVSVSMSKISGKPKPVYSTTSTFLPTLMSGYISGSDSDIDAGYYKDRNGKKKGPAQPKERKNRMGQQARRALWEKKFRKNANHVKKGEAGQGREKIEERIKQGRVGSGEKHEGSIQKKGKNIETEGPLHPSWEAARKAKEQQAKVQEAVMGKPMGKKIVFS